MKDVGRSTVRVTALIFFSLSAGTIARAQHTYYVSSSTGSDSNTAAQAQSKTTPWAHAPGMPNATGNAASYTLVAGDHIVLKGCDTWTFSGTLGWTINVTATSSSYVLAGGLDQTWYNTSACPSAWNRPILSGGGTYPGTSGIAMVYLSSSQYVDVEWIEFTGLQSATTNVYYIDSGSCTGCIYESNYFHNITEASGTKFGGLAIQGNSATGCIVRLNYFDNGDGSVDGGFLYANGCGTLYENYMANSSGCVVGSFSTAHDNTFVNCGLNPESGTSFHNNIFESNTDYSGGMRFYGNFIIHGNVGNAANSAQVQFAPQAGDTTYIFNNVWADSNPGAPHNIICGQAGVNPNGHCYIFNNTNECGADSGAGSPPGNTCATWGSTGSGTIINDHWITSQGSPAITNVSGATLTTSNLVVQPLSTANGQGYNISQTCSGQDCPFYPTSGGSTIGAGLAASTMVSLCATISGLDAAAGTACLSDSTVGVAINSATHTVIGPARTTNLRPVSGAWDAGAYQFLATSGSAPQPPTGLIASVQ